MTDVPGETIKKKQKKNNSINSKTQTLGKKRRGEEKRGDESRGLNLVSGRKPFDSSPAEGG